MHAELGEHVLRVGQHIHQMGDRRALVAADIADARLQQRLGDGEDAFAAEFLPGAELQIPYFFCKGPLCHDPLRSVRSAGKSQMLRKRTGVCPMLAVTSANTFIVKGCAVDAVSDNLLRPSD